MNEDLWRFTNPNDNISRPAEETQQPSFWHFY